MAWQVFPNSRRASELARTFGVGDHEIGEGSPGVDGETHHGSLTVKW